MVCGLLQRMADTNVTLAFEDAQVIPPFSMEETGDRDDRDDRDDTDDTDDTYYTDNTLLFHEILQIIIKKIILWPLE